MFCFGSVSQDDIDGHGLSVRKKLSFDSDEDASSSKSWQQAYQCTSSDSDWLQSGGLELSEASELEEESYPPLSTVADLPEESAHKGTIHSENNLHYFYLSLGIGNKKIGVRKGGTKERNNLFDSFVTLTPFGFFFRLHRSWPCLRQGEGAQTGDGGRADGLHVRWCVSQ